MKTLRILLLLGMFFAASAVRGADFVGIGDELTLEFSDLTQVDKLLQMENGKPRVGAKLVLYLDGRMMGIEPHVKHYKTGSQKLIFLLQQTSENRHHWRLLLDKVTKNPQETVEATVGLQDNSRAYESPTNGKVALRPYMATEWMIATAILLAALLVGIVVLGKKTNLLRDSGPQTDGNAVVLGAFSLGRVQMVWWFFVIVCSYLAIWLFFGDRNSLNSTVLLLLGISAGTGFFARVIDTGKAEEVRKVSTEIRQRTEQNLHPPAQQVAVALEGPAMPVLPDPALSELQGRLKSLVAPVETPGFWRFFTDILSDENGVSLPRLQMAVWTVVLSAVFIVELWRTKSMPVLDNTLLFLMGISNGAFVGFKISEKQSVPAQMLETSKKP